MSDETYLSLYNRAVWSNRDPTSDLRLSKLCATRNVLTNKHHFIAVPILYVAFAEKTKYSNQKLIDFFYFALFYNFFF